MNKIIKNTIIAFQALLLLSAFNAQLMAQNINVDNIKIKVGTGYYISTAGSMHLQNSGAIDNSGTLKIGSNWTNNANGLINASAGTVELNGATQQTIGGSAVTIFNNLIINNSNGITLAGNIIVNGTLTFTNGKITTGANYVILGNAATVTGAGAGMYVNGNLRRFIPATANAVVNFQIGDATNYTPVQLTFVGTPSGASSIDAATSVAAPPLASGISQTQYVNRQWNLTNNGVTGFTSYSAIFNFAALDIIGGANTANFIVANLNTPNWSLPTVGAKTSTSTEITGATGFGTFALGVANDITWYLDADNDGYYVSTTLSVSSPGTGYTSTLPANGQGDCNDNDVNVYALPTASTITAGSATTFCSGGSVTLSGNNGGVWSTNATTPTISVTTSGTYSVTTTNSCGSATSNSIEVTVNPLPTASTITAGGATTFCSGGSVTLSGNNGGTWSTNATTPSISVTTSGTYSVTTTNSCGSTTSNSIEVTVNTCNTIPTTQLRSIDCGKTGLTLNAQVACVAVAGATNYEFEFTNPTTNAIYATKVMSGTFIAGNNVTPNLQWNTQYKCKVRAKVGGIWGNYGAACIIGLVQNPAVVGVPLTSLRSTSCNQLNLLPTATIACQQISMSAGYEFEFTDMVTNAVTTKVSSLIYLPLATVTPTLIPMHTYSVKVRAKQNTTWGSYGQACNIRILGATAARTAMNTDQETVDAMVSEMEEERMNTDMPMDILLFPNPMMDEATVVITSSQNEKVTIAITDITGKVVSNDIFNTNSTFSIQNSELRSGIYFLTATTTSGERKTIKVVKQ